MTPIAYAATASASAHASASNGGTATAESKATASDEGNAVSNSNADATNGGTATAKSETVASGDETAECNTNAVSDGATVNDECKDIKGDTEKANKTATSLEKDELLSTKDTKSDLESEDEGVVGMIKGFLKWLHLM